MKEISGLAASRKHEGVLWVHNDSGDDPVVYAINIQGALLGTYQIEGATHRDWEDIAIGPGPKTGKDYLYIGDIGGNGGNYGYINIYRVEEPNVLQDQPLAGMTTGPATRIQLHYPKAWYDAETLMLDPLTKDLYIIAKQQYSKMFKRLIPGGGQVFYVPYPYSETTMQYKNTMTVSLSTGGEISSDGRMILVRNYSTAYYWQVIEGQPLWEAFNNKPCPVPLARERQGEAVCFDNRNEGFFTVSEGNEPPLYYYQRKVCDCNEVPPENLSDTD